MLNIEIIQYVVFIDKQHRNFRAFRLLSEKTIFPTIILLRFQYRENDLLFFYEIGYNELLKNLKSFLNLFLI